jgi:hypothetical protein
MSRGPFAIPAPAFVLAAVMTLALISSSLAQQVPDTSFAPPIAAPAFPAGQGPVVLIDEGHRNFHTLGGRFQPFARLAMRDGFTVRARGGRLTREGLDSARVLVVANAIEPRNTMNQHLPVWSAFDTTEIRVVEQWVRDGGALLLVADHMPFGGAAEDLAAAFGIMTTNSFANDATGESEFSFRRASGGLRAHLITDGRGPDERVDSVKVFTGQAFRAVREVDTLMVLGRGAYVEFPVVAWQFSELTPNMRADGMMMGAALTHGRGRVVVFGEAAMLTAQLAGPQREPVGMNSPEAADHPRLVLNTLRWLAGVTGEGKGRPRDRRR